MATEASQPLKISGNAAADLSASQYCFVKYDASGNIVVATAATDAVIGVLQNKPKALGQMAEIVVIGVTKVIAPGSVAVGAFIGPDSSGKAQSVTLAQEGGTYDATPAKRAVGMKYEGPGTGQGAASTNDVYMAIVNCLNPLPAK